MAGRRPKPTALKVLEGNPGKRPLNRAEPTSKLAEVRPPRGMTSRARAYWRSLAPLLIEMRILTEADCLLLRQLCETLADEERFRKVWMEQGQSYETRNKLGELCIKPRPEVAMSHAAKLAGLRMMIELGLSPATRSRIKVAPQKERDPFEEFLNAPEPNR